MKKRVRLAALGMTAAMILGACSSAGSSGETKQEAGNAQTHKIVPPENSISFAERCKSTLKATKA